MENKSDKKQAIKLFTDSDDELFSTITSVKVTTETNATTNSSDVAQSSIEENKMVPKLFTDSDEEMLHKETNSSNAQFVDSKIAKKPVSKLFTESEEEIFATPKEADMTKEGNTVLSESIDELNPEVTLSKTDNEVTSNSSVSQPPTEIKSTEKKTSKLFTESDEDIFANFSKSTAKKTSRLFGSDDDSDGELFQKSKSKTSEQKSSNTKAVLPKSQVHSKKGLFDDSSSDDDLFSSGNKNGKNTGRFNFFFDLYICSVFLMRLISLHYSMALL